MRLARRAQQAVRGQGTKITHANRRCLCSAPAAAVAEEPPPPPVIVVSSTRGLLMLESYLIELPPGKIVHVGEEQHEACVLFKQHGHYFATLTNKKVDEEGYAALHGQGVVPTHDVLTVDLPPRAELVGRQVDCFAQPLDGGSQFSGVAVTVPVFADQASGSERGLIMDNLHTGWLAIDALTPIGRGQSMLLVGPEGTGKTTIATGAVLASRLPASLPLHTIYTCLSDDDGVQTLNSFETPVISLAPRAAGAGAASLPSIERYLMAATAVAIGEVHRDNGEDALVILDELSAFRDLWQTAAEVSAEHDSVLRYANGQHEITELRPYYSHLIQRSSKLIDTVVRDENGEVVEKTKGGTMSVLTLIEADPPEDEPLSEEAGVSTTAEGGYPMSVFEEEGYASEALARLQKLADYKVPITDEVLGKMKVPIPQATLESTADVATETAGEDGGDSFFKEERREVEVLGAPVSPQRRHTEEMMSLSDGHILLDAAEFLEQKPAISPKTSLTRIRDTRSPALQDVGNKLRFLMSAYADLSTEAKESARPETRAMRSQLAAWQTVLQQPPGKPLALEHAVVLLFAVSKGYFSSAETDDSRCAPLSVIVGGEDSALVQYVEGAVPEVMAAIRETGELPDEAAAQLHMNIRVFVALQVAQQTGEAVNATNVASASEPVLAATVKNDSREEAQAKQQQVEASMAENMAKEQAKKAKRVKAGKF